MINNCLVERGVGQFGQTAAFGMQKPQVRILSPRLADEWNGKPFKAHNLRDSGFDSRVRYCGCGRLGNAPDCGSGTCGFEPRRSPHACLTQLGECFPYKEEVVGSSPTVSILSTTRWIEEW